MTRPSSSLRRKLPLLISALLCLVVTAVCWSAYHQVEGVLLNATGARLAGVTQQLASMLEESSRRVRRDARELAEAPALAAALARPSAASRLEAQRVLEGARGGAAESRSYALWSRDGERVLAVGPLVPAGDGYPLLVAGAGRTPAVATGVGRIVRSGDGAMYPVAVPVLGGARDTVGVLIVYRRLTGQGAGQVAGLIGSRATLLVGNASGGVWTDMVRVVEGPPPSFPRGVPAEYAAAGQRRIGVAMPIRSTPWLVLVQSPREAALAPARQFVLAIAGVAFMFIVLGTVGAWVLSHRVTAPLVEVTRAAEDVARGDYTRRVEVARHDEIGSLAASFNSMATQVQAAAGDLAAHAGELEATNAQLRESEERYRRLVEAAHEGICTVDPTGVITYVNARLAEMLGYAAPALLGRSIFDCMHPETAVEARTRFARRYRGIAESREVPFRRQDGTTIWTNKSASSLFDAAGHFVGALFMLGDVSERHEAQERLARSERHFRALIEHAPDVIAILDARGVIQYASPALERYAGESVESLVGTPALGRIHPDDLATAQAALARVIADPGRPVHVEYRYRHHDGGWRRLSSVASNLLADPAVAGIVVNSRDVTEQRALEAQLLQAQKMEAVGQLAGGVAHDFNNLLTVITSYSGMLLTELPADDPTRDDIQEIRRAADRAAGLTRQLLAFSRQQVLEPQVLDVNAVVRDMEKMLHRVLREDVRLETALAPALREVYADAGQLEQVIVNLAVNASDAMPGGGTLTLETADVELDADYGSQHPEVAPGPYVMLAVSDTGVGMNAATQAQIFEPFFTTKEVGKGTGLGLSTVYGIVKQSGGHIWVYSEPGRGTTFKIYLPRAGAASTARARAGLDPVLHSGSETILLVEDEVAVRTVARRILEQSGYRVLEARSGGEALRMAQEEGAGVDLVITDVIMPETSGPELAARLRRRRPDVRVLFMSGYTDDVVQRQNLVEPGAAFLQKPFSPEGLTRKVREALAQA